MKNSPISTVMLVVLAFCTVLSAVACLKFISRSRELRRLQNTVALINAKNVGMNALVTDLVEYSKKNPAIDPLLESVGIKSAKTNTAAVKPAK